MNGREYQKKKLNTMAPICWICRSYNKTAFLSLLQCLCPAANSDFVIGQKWRLSTLRTADVYHHAKFGDNISNGGRVIAIFRFSKWRPAAIMDFVVAQKWRHGTLRADHG